MGTEKLETQTRDKLGIKQTRSQTIEPIRFRG